MTIFYCVRHGKTVFNNNMTFQGGDSDSPLLPEGKKAAQLVGNYLKDIPFDKVFVSPQNRAQATAKLLIAEHSLPLSLINSDLLREMRFGSWDGYPESNFHHEEEFQNLVHRPHLYKPDAFGGESFEAMIERGSQFFSETSLASPSGKILIVSHGLFLQTLLKTFQNIPLSDIRKGDLLDNTSVTTLKVNPKENEFIIEKWNDTSFLQ